MLVKTGYGYIKNTKGNIIAKYELPKGEHPEKKGYTYYEVASKEELDKIEVYIEPIVQTDEQLADELIAKKIKELAVSELKKEGKLDKDGKLVK